MAAPLRILTVVGARPQIIKAAALSSAFAEAGSTVVQETLLHTGQHYDDGMSRVFFEELGVPAPVVTLQPITGATDNATRMATMVEGIGRAIGDNHPDVVLVYGDTDSTLAGAIAAVKLGVPIAHVEAGLRSHDRSMPEEVNRVLTDHCATWLFCPTPAAVEDLRREGITDGDKGRIVRLVGDVMYDNSLRFARQAERQGILQQLGLEAGKFMLATVHRAHNTDDPARLEAIMRALMQVSVEHGLPVMLPLHPRTKARLDLPAMTVLARTIQGSNDLRLLPPMGHLDMTALEKGAQVVLTDSGGVQKEAFFHGVPVVVLRDVTEWGELVEHGWAILADSDPDRIAAAVRTFLEKPPSDPPRLHGDGRAAMHIRDELLRTAPRR